MAGEAVGAMEMDRKAEGDEEAPKKKSFLPFSKREKKPDIPYGPEHPDWNPAFPDGLPPETWCHFIFKYVCCIFIFMGMEGCWNYDALLLYGRV